MGFSRGEKIFLIASLVLSLLGWFFLCSPKWREASLLKRELQLMTQKTEGAKETIEAAERLKEELERARLRTRYLDERILSRRDLTRVLDQLAEAAGRHHVRILSMKPLEGEKEAPDSLFQALPIEMEIRCRYLDLGRYLEDLKDRPFLLNVKSLEMRLDEKEPPFLSVHLILAAYRWRSAERVKEPG